MRASASGAHQFRSDVSTSRVKRFRERQRNGEAGAGGAVSATPPESETDSETEKEKKKDARASGARYSTEFEARFWQPYPRTPNMSKLEAWKAWEKSPDDHAAIVAAGPHLRPDVRKRTVPDLVISWIRTFTYQARLSAIDLNGVRVPFPRGARKLILLVHT